MKILSIGQVGWDVTTINGVTHRNYGGSVLHFCLAAALMGINVDMLCYVNRKEWTTIIERLRQIGIGTKHIINFDHTICFNMYYDEEFSFIEDQFSMNISDAEPCIYERIPHIGKYDLYNICETVPEQDCKTLQEIIRFNRNAKISMQFHIDNLMRNKEVYISLLDKVDFIFMNLKEALFLANCSTIQGAIDFLKSKIKYCAFVTSHTKNYAITSTHTLVSNALDTNVIVDPTGAGDCFAGGAVAGLCLSNCLQTAMRFGAICAYFKLRDYSSNFLLKLL